MSIKPEVYFSTLHVYHLRPPQGRGGASLQSNGVVVAS